VAGGRKEEIDSSRRLFGQIVLFMAQGVVRWSIYSTEDAICSAGGYI